MEKIKNKNPLKYYFAGNKIVVIVFVSILVGLKIDEKFNFKINAATVILSTLSIIYCLYSLVVIVTKENKKKKTQK